jgi:hypothetical protein
MTKYFGIFESINDIESQFDVDTGLTDENILLAVYTNEDYAGNAYVLFEKDGKVFEVEGSHCSCNGLEYQWKPGIATWASLALRIENIGNGLSFSGYPWQFKQTYIDLVSSKVGQESK